MSNRGRDPGTLQAGKTADIPVVNDNALSDLRDLPDGRIVLQDGVVMRNSDRHPNGPN